MMPFCSHYLRPCKTKQTSFVQGEEEVEEVVVEEVEEEEEVVVVVVVIVPEEEAVCIREEAQAESEVY